MANFKIRSRRIGARVVPVMALATSFGVTASNPSLAAFRGKVWIVAAQTNADFPNIPTRAPDVTFVTDHINFIGEGPETDNPKIFTDYRMDDFLKSTHTTSNVTYSGKPNSFLPGNRAVTTTTPTSDGVGGGSFGSYETMMELTGAVVLKNGQRISLTHDDGMSIMIDGSLVGGPGSGSTNFVTSENPIWTGSTGTHKIDILYIEEGGGPAQLVFSPAAQRP